MFPKLGVLADPPGMGLRDPAFPLKCPRSVGRDQADVPPSFKLQASGEAGTNDGTPTFTQKVAGQYLRGQRTGRVGGMLGGGGRSEFRLPGPQLVSCWGRGPSPASPSLPRRGRRPHSASSSRPAFLGASGGARGPSLGFHTTRPISSFSGLLLEDRSPGSPSRAWARCLWVSLLTRVWGLPAASPLRSRVTRFPVHVPLTLSLAVSAPLALGGPPSFSGSV